VRPATSSSEGQEKRVCECGHYEIRAIDSLAPETTKTPDITSDPVTSDSIVTVAPPVTTEPPQITTPSSEPGTSEFTSTTPDTTVNTSTSDTVERITSTEESKPEPGTDSNSNHSGKESGCSSSIGGACILFVALAGVSFAVKKKKTLK